MSLPKKNLIHSFRLIDYHRIMKLTGQSALNSFAYHRKYLGDLAAKNMKEVVSF